jgi:F-type H+-transporting ATPase subunit a
MDLSSDQHILWQYGFLDLNVTVVTTWAVMALMAFGAARVTGKLRAGVPGSRWETLLEIAILAILKQLEEVGLSHPRRYLGFVGTLFLFVAVSTLLTIVPGYEPPTGSLSTTAALALCVFVAVPFFGISEQGVGGYLKTYAEPNLFILPFNLIGELSRTLALAIRLFGNMMSGVMIINILLTITPFLFPVAMTMLGLLTGLVQAYIFSILAAVYLAAATQTHKSRLEPVPEPAS